MVDDNGNGKDGMGFVTDNPMLLFQLFQSDVIAAEIDWENERFVFYPVNTLPTGTE